MRWHDPDWRGLPIHEADIAAAAVAALLSDGHHGRAYDLLPGEIPEFSAEEWDAALIPLPTVEEVTGRPARRYASWAVDHAADFR
ncbi:MAG TPA: hypothetical protein VGP26_15695 [Actinophytocola sp.]|nr:hypothetical protein [Actinophytocola sp.]